MSVRCNISSDEETGEFDLDFVKVPRTGEALEIAGAEGANTFRVTRVVHRVGATVAPSILLEITRKIL